MPSVFVRSFVMILLCVMTASAHAQESVDLENGLTLYCSWDTDMVPDYNAGAKSWTGVYQQADGHLKHALRITDKPMKIMPNGNFTRDQGTLSLWFKLDEQDASIHQSVISATNFRFQLYRQKNQVFFMTGAKLPDSNFKWDYSLLLHNKDVPSDQWLHLLMTWDKKNGNKVVYLNSKQAGKTQTPLIEPGPGSQSLTIGDGAPGVYDELKVWSRVLNDEEIQAVCKDAAIKPHTAAQANPDIKWPIEPQLAYFNYTDSIVAPGESVTVQIPFQNNTLQKMQAKFRLQVLDTWEKQIGNAEDISLQLDAGQKTSITRNYTINQLGCYKIRVTNLDSQDRMREVTSFAVLPSANPPAHPFFGTHANMAANMPEMARRLGYTHNRVHNMTQFTWWVRLEPEPGQWDTRHRNQETYQRYVDLGFTHYGQWFGAPYWAVKLGDGSQPQPGKPNSYPAGWVPDNEQALRDYITRTINQYPQITQWEMWNEPYVSMFWQGSPDQYVAMCRIMYQQAKLTKPSLQIFAQLPYDSPWLDRVLSLGMLDYCDGIAFHQYFNATDHPQSVAVPATKLRARLKAYGREDIPLINSESGVTGTTFLRGLDIPEYSPEQLKSEFKFRQAASMMVQGNVMLMSMGLAGRYHYFHQPVNIQKGRAYPTYTTCEITRSPLPMAVTNAILVWQLDGGSFKQALNPVDGLRVYLFKRNDGKTLAVAWCEDQSQISLKLPASITVLNMMGNPLENKGKINISDEPVYMVVDQSVELTAQSFTASNIAIIAKPQKQVTVDKSPIASLPPMPDFQVATEMGPSRLHPVDLSNFVNMSLADPIQGDGQGGWTDEGPNNDARMLSPGKHTWFGVPFVLPGKTNLDPSVITLHGMTFQSGSKQVGPISVNQSKVRGLFFAHAANWMSGKESEVPATYTIHYADGTNVQLPMHGGRQINNWWFPPAENEDCHAVQFTHPDPITRQKADRYLRVVYWENPHTQKPITSITVESTDPKMTYVLCGITVATW